MSGHQKAQASGVCVHRATVAVICSFLWTWVAQVQAETADSGNSGDSLKEIVVTATKRAESIQTVPVSITALSAQDLKDIGATQFADYATTVPNLSFGYAGAGREVSRLFQIRGIFGADTSALYIDDTPVPVSMDPRVLDVERVEVLRGPQGSLFGSRSMGGLVRIITQQPDEHAESGSVDLRGGAVDHGKQDYLANGSLNLPLVDGRVALRTSAYFVVDGGFLNRLVDPDATIWGQPQGEGKIGPNDYTVNGINKDTTEGAQVALRIDVTDALTITPSVFYQKLESDSPPFTEYSANNNTFVQQFNFPQTGIDSWSLEALLAELKLPGGRLVSSSSYFSRRTYDVEDGTLALAPPPPAPGLWGLATSPIATTLATNTYLWTQEIRYLSELEGPLSFITGVFFQNSHDLSAYPPESIVQAGTFANSPNGYGLPAGQSFFNQYSDLNSNELGLFGELSYRFAPDWTATAGGRWYSYRASQSRVDGGTLYDLFGLNPPLISPRVSDSEDGFNPKAGVKFQPTQDVMIYADAAKGFRPGGPNDESSVCSALGAPKVPPTYGSDSVWSYELGEKTTWLDRRLTADVSAFYIKWSDYRVTIACPGGLGFGYDINTGEATSKGAEAEFAVRPLDHLTFTLAAGYTDAKITNAGSAASVIQVGSPLTNVPRWNGNAALDGSVPLSGALSGYGHVDYRYVGNSLGLIELSDASGQLGTSTQLRPSYDLVNLRLGIRRGPADVSVYVDNLTNQHPNLGTPIPLSAALPLVAVGPPRVIGAELRYSF